MRERVRSEEGLKKEALRTWKAALSVQYVWLMYLPGMFSPAPGAGDSGSITARFHVGVMHGCLHVPHALPR